MKFAWTQGRIATQSECYWWVEAAAKMGRIPAAHIAANQCLLLELSRKAYHRLKRQFKEDRHPLTPPNDQFFVPGNPARDNVRPKVAEIHAAVSQVLKDHGY